jgi:hypothetical protein
LWAVIPMSSVRQESQVTLTDASRDTPAAPAPAPEPSLAAPSLAPLAQPEAAATAARAPGSPAASGRGQVMNDGRRAADALAKHTREERADAAAFEKPAEAPQTLRETVTVTGETPPVDTAQTLASQRARNDAPAQPAPLLELKRTVQERVAVAPPPAAPAQARPAPAATAAAAAPGRAAGSAALFKASVAIVPIPSPVATTRWHIVDGQRVERATIDDRFEPVVLPAPATLTAGAAPSASVCWVVGRAGRVFLTIDGQRFTPVVFPEPIDLVGVTATDARTATVRAADGRSFVTKDGGTTWAAGSPF